MSINSERQKLAWQGLHYSTQRIDLLVISISGAGIYVCLEAIKFLKEQTIEVHWLIHLSGVLFLLGIGINFLSQISGRKANWYDYLMCEELIALETCKKKDRSKHQCNADKYDEKAETHSNRTGKLTHGSIAAMAAGLISLLAYFLFIF